VTRTFLRFTAAGADRLLALDSVVEVVPMMRLHASGAEGSRRFRGILSYRGRMLPVFDFTDAVRPHSHEWFLIIVDDGRTEAAVVAEDVLDVVDVPTEGVSHIDSGALRHVDGASVDGAYLPIVDCQDLRG